VRPLSDKVSELSQLGPAIAALGSALGGLNG
jgi:hypothetical protein